MHNINWFDLNTLEATCIKKEPSESPQPLSPPANSSFRPPALPSTSCRLDSTTSLANTNRVRPYPSLKREETPLSSEEPGIMSHTPDHGNWPLPGTRNSGNGAQVVVQHQHSDNGESPYPLGHQMISDTFTSGQMHSHNGIGPASSSSSLTSSLTGAIGNTVITSNSRQSRSPPSQIDNTYGNDWVTSSPMHFQHLPLGMHHSTFPGVPVLEDMTFQGLMSQDLSTFEPGTHRNASPDSVSSSSSTFGHYTGYTAQSRQSSSGYPASSIPSTPFSGVPEPSGQDFETEVVQLRRKVHELEAECTRAHNLIGAHGLQGPLYGGLPTPQTTPPMSSSFQSSWKARTAARKRIFCSLNRAGNALCAWHDSRRERRTFPPRNAPPGYLNCGCTYEEALFEESLARHSVGSYHPGETVRMDPALRNPLLKLLQQRYGYQDGDFERDPVTGDWIDGEGPAIWEQQAHSGASARRRMDIDRH